MKRFLLTLAVMFLPALAEATTWHAGTGGSDANNCTAAQTVATRKLTIAAGLACMTTAGGGGHTLYITAGTYSETGLAPPSGTSGAHNVVRSYSSDNVVFTNVLGTFNFYNTGRQYVDIVGTCTTGLNRTCTMDFNASGVAFGKVELGGSSHITLDGVRVRNVVVGGPVTSGVGSNIAGDNITFRNCRVDHNGTTPDAEGQAGYAFYIGGDNNLVENCELDNNGGYGIHQYSEDQSPSNNVYRYNFIHDNGQLVTGNVADGILLSGCQQSSECPSTTPTNNAAYGNVIWNNARGYGVRFNRCLNCNVYNNTVYNNGFGNGAGGIYVQNASGTTNIKNNISSSNYFQFYHEPGQSPTYEKNLCSANGTGCDSALTEASSNTFNDAANAIFTIKTGSAAIANGTNLAAVVNTDIVGSTWQVPMGIGAYQYIGPPVPCPTVAQALVASYGFEGAGTNSAGGGVGSATLGSGWSYTGSGKYGQGATTTGTAGITVSDNDALDFCNGFTLEGWVNLPNTSGDYVLIVKNPNSQAVLFSSISGYCGSGKPVGGIGQGGGVNACYETSLTTGSFQHLAVTYDATLPSANLKLYVNGSGVTSANSTASLDATTGTLQFCTSGFGETCPSGTVVDEIRIYNYARSAAQITTDMNTPIVPLTAPTLKVSGTMKFGASATALKLPGGS